MRIAALAALIGALVAAPLAARSAFDGDWVADLDTQSGLATDDYLVKDGQYRCASCEPPRAYPADGQPHPITGDPDVVTESVTIAGPRSIVTHIVGPPLDRTTTMTVAPDDQTATYISIDHRPGIKAPLRTEYLAKRTAAAPPGAHPVSGTWQGVRYVSVPEVVRTTRLRVSGDRFSYATPLGTHFAAQLGGRDVLVRPGVSVAVRRLGARRIEEQMKQDGRLVTTRIFTVAADGRSMEIATTNLGNGITFRATSRRASSPRF